jgi:DNA-directed RNA polymerase beta subunit
MKRSQVDEILSKVKKQASAVSQVRAFLPNRSKKDDNNNGIPDDEEEYVPVGVKGLLSASQKLLAINRGLDKPDERDSLLFKRILTTDKLLSERIKLDNGRVKGSMLPLIAKHKNLKAVGPFSFDPYMEQFLIGNPLSSPLEEINPLHLLEQSRRATQMGPGGIGTENAITEAMQAIRTDQFGFVSSLEGPESEKIGIDTRMAWGSKIGSDGKPYQKFFNRKTGKYQWMSPEDLDGLTIKLPD